MADDKKEHPLADMASPVNLIGLLAFLGVAFGVVYLLGAPGIEQIYHEWADADVALGTIGVWLMTHLSVVGLLPVLPIKWHLGAYPYYVPAGVVAGLIAGLLAKKVAAFFLIKPRESVLEDPLNEIRHYGASNPELSHLEYILPVCPSYDQERLFTDIYVAQTPLSSPSVPESEVAQ
jgi:hypothetical protein